MNKFISLLGHTVPLYRSNIDTDQIIPKQFLKRIERTGYGAFLFYDWRFNADGSPIGGFVLNDSRYYEASVLITGENFGCGSSREHAPWSLIDYGFHAIIAPSFADIFYNNSLKNGLLPIVLSEAQCTELSEKAESGSHQLAIDLKKQAVWDTAGFQAGFEIDAFRRHCLLNGLDDIGLTLEHEAKISAFESARSVW
jgi:3-isopropylmalate/(R)-2-methylmalate dehydratase small subunit